MKFLSIDQSMSSCACVVFDGKEAIFKEVIRTTGAKNIADKSPWVQYFENPVEQMSFITGKILDIVESFQVDHVVCESLSFGSAGNATRDLAGLFFCIQLRLLLEGFRMDQLHTVAPTSVKSWARGRLPGEQQEFKYEKGKMEKIKMGKDEMMNVCELLFPGFLKGYTKTGKNGGATDLADAYLIGRCFLDRYQ